jgi:CMP-N,N'-diacetyllegionaminic acid synthase
MKILTIIPARSGSKGIPDKNIHEFRGDPLFTHSIRHAKESKYVKSMRIFVSTDSEKYAHIAKQYGAEVPILRPKELAQDDSIDSEFILHALDVYSHLGYEPDILLQLRPTQPMRTPKMIDDCIETLMSNETYTSLRTVIPVKKTPFKMYTMESGILKPLYPSLCEMPRQKLKPCYLHNGYIDIYKPDVIRRGELLGETPYPFIMGEEDDVDIDELGDIPRMVS